MFFESVSPLLTKQGVEVSSRGELVVLQIGNVDLPMHYEHAFAVSKWIREEGQAIKRLTGLAKTTRSLGVLEDASAKAKPLPREAGAAIHVKPKLQDWQRSDVKSEGRLVAIKVGSKTIRLHYSNALKVAQWLRVRAKESRNRAGDVRHWAEIGSDTQ